MEERVLEKTRCYLAGPMQYTEDGKSWREDLTETLTELGVTVFDPYKNIFITDKQETNDANGIFARLLAEERYAELADIMRQTRNADLRITDMSDFLVVYVNTTMYTVGTWEEVFAANSSKKPIFLVVEGGKQKCPLWLFGVVPHEYIFDTLTDLKIYLRLVSEGVEELDEGRWKLLKKEYR